MTPLFARVPSMIWIAAGLMGLGTLGVRFTPRHTHLRGFADMLFLCGFYLFLMALMVIGFPIFIQP